MVCDVNRGPYIFYVHDTLTLNPSLFFYIPSKIINFADAAFRKMSLAALKIWQIR